MLLVVHDVLMMKYLLGLPGLMEGDDRVRMCYTFVDEPLSSQIHTECQLAGLRFVPPAVASLRWWDLVIGAHNGFAPAFHPDIQKVLLWHSLASGKRVITSDPEKRSKYLRCNTVLSGGRPAYRAILESSPSAKLLAERNVPELRGTIEMVGSLIADAMLEQNHQRAVIRGRMGFAAEDKVVFVGSTCGDASLMETIGPQLIQEARRLRHQYRFILSAHHCQWRRCSASEPSLGESLLKHECEGFLVVRPHQEVVPFLIAADAAIIDFSSLSEYCALLRKPMAFVPFDDSLLLEDSHSWQIVRISPRLQSPGDLQSILNSLFAEYPLPALDRIARDLLVCPGEARARITALLYRLLRLQPRSRDTARMMPNGEG